MQSAHGGSGRAERGRGVEQVKGSLRELLLAYSGRPLSVAQLPYGACPAVSGRTARVCSRERRRAGEWDPRRLARGLPS
jgi:hypothetical protein